MFQSKRSQRVLAFNKAAFLYLAALLALFNGFSYLAPSTITLPNVAITLTIAAILWVFVTGEETSQDERRFPVITIEYLLGVALGVVAFVVIGVYLLSGIE